jgi:hypothetical protein
MCANEKKVIETGFMLVMLLTTMTAFAQDEIDEEEDLMPAVDTSAIEVKTAANIVTRRGTGDSVMDEMELGRTEITGNQELPKVLYIVPWQKADPGDLMGKPINTLLDEVLAPIDREEFVRQVDYYGDLHSESEDE